MITSMTGYGRGNASAGDAEIAVELRSVNNRFLDIALKLPYSLGAYEQNIRELIGSYISRGRVSVWISMKGADAAVSRFSLNQTLVKSFLTVAEELRQQYGFSGQLSLESVLTLPDVLEKEIEEGADEATWNCARRALTEALEQINAMRRREGEEIGKDFIARINALEACVMRIKQLADPGPEIELDKLRERVRRLIDGEVDHERLEQELALIADRIDISEEITRFFSHITLFRELLNAEPSQGRKLNFLLQEMNREVNTMASKAYSAEISHLVVELKEEIEKIREQVQNIE